MVYAAIDPPSGSLRGIRVIDMSALGPGPFCGMLLADHGADVIAVARPSSGDDPDPAGSFARGKRSIVVDLRSPDGPAVIRRLCESADVLIESNRPGTLERRGLGPDQLLADNPRLIYTRLTGWGQHGPYARRVGHDINYIAVAGALGAIGNGAPVPPLNIVGDFASGSLMAMLGIVMALLERERTGKGQVVDAAMVDGAALLLSAQLAEFNDGQWDGRGSSPLSGSAPFYGAYECADGRWFAVGAIERRFYVAFLDALGIGDVALDSQYDVHEWPALRKRVADAFAAQPREHWANAFAGIDGCGSEVLDIDELLADPHLRARGTVFERNGRVEAAPAPRLSESGGRAGKRPDATGQHTVDVLIDVGFSADEIAELRSSRAVVAG
jgi:alpha-methylacyl-CoA racemase